MRSRFDEQLSKLSEELIIMGALCEKSIGLSAESLYTGDLVLAAQVANISEQVTKKEKDIESLCLRLLLQQQPVARDLRAISSALKMITDMSRIGDQAEDIAEIIITAKIRAGEDAMDIRNMATAAIKMVTDSINAYVRRDVIIAKAVIDYDDVVDDYFDKIKQDLIEAFSNPEADGEYTLDLLMIAKYFERIADHAVNIAEWVLFSITGNKEGIIEGEN